MAARKTALLVDDADDVGDSLQDAVSERGAHIDVVRDLQSAITCLKRHAYCGLIVNLAVVDGNGLNLLHTLEKERINVPIVVITPELPDAVRSLPIARQIKLVMSKPIEISLLAGICLGLCGMEA